MAHRKTGKASSVLPFLQLPLTFPFLGVSARPLRFSSDISDRPGGKVQLYEVHCNFPRWESVLFISPWFDICYLTRITTKKRRGCLQSLGNRLIRRTMIRLQASFGLESRDGTQGVTNATSSQIYSRPT